jgi:hypothetical protein
MSLDINNVLIINSCTLPNANYMKLIITRNIINYNDNLS